MNEFIKTHFIRLKQSYRSHGRMPQSSYDRIIRSNRINLHSNADNITHIIHFQDKIHIGIKYRTYRYTLAGNALVYSTIKSLISNLKNNNSTLKVATENQADSTSIDVYSAAISRACSKVQMLKTFYKDSFKTIFGY